MRLAAGGLLAAAGFAPGLAADFAEAFDAVFAAAFAVAAVFERRKSGLERRVTLGLARAHALLTLRFGLDLHGDGRGRSFPAPFGQ